MYIKSLNHRYSPLLGTITLIAVAFFIFSAKTIVTGQWFLIPELFAITSIAVLYVKKPSWALAILITLSINIFGAVPFTSLPSIPLSGLGSLFPHDILLLLFTSIMFLKYCTRSNESIRSSISYPIIALILLTVGQGIRSFFEGNDPHFIVNQMRPIAFYLSYFLIIGSIKREKDLIHFIKLLILIGIISAGITYFQIITGTKLASTVVAYRTEYSMFQVISLSLFVMTFVFLTLFSIAIGQKGRIKSFLGVNIILVWIGGSIVLMLMRNIWVSTLLAMSVIIMLNTRVKKPIIILLLAFGFFIIGAPVIEDIAGSKSLPFILSDRISSTYHDVGNLSGSFRKRTEGAKIRWDYMINNNPIFGQGFKGRISRMQSDRWDPTDSLYALHNIIAFLSVRYGLFGFFIIGWLLFTVFYKAIFLFRTLPPSYKKLLVCAILAFNIQIVISSYFGSPLFQTFGIVIVAPSWAVLELIERFHKQEQRENFIAGETG